MTFLSKLWAKIEEAKMERLKAYVESLDSWVPSYAIEGALRSLGRRELALTTKEDIKAAVDIFDSEKAKRWRELKKKHPQSIIDYQLRNGKRVKVYLTKTGKWRKVREEKGGRGSNALLNPLQT